MTKNISSGYAGQFTSVQRPPKLQYKAIPELFDLEFVPKQVGSDTKMGKSGRRQETARRDDTVQIIKPLTRYPSPIYNNSGVNTC